MSVSPELIEWTFFLPSRFKKCSPPVESGGAESGDEGEWRTDFLWRQAVFFFGARMGSCGTVLYCTEELLDFLD